MNYKDNIFRFVYVCLAAVTPLSESVAEPFQPDGTTTFATAENPVMWADYPDPDVIRVGDWFYMMSTTMHLMPGAPVMRSKDLVSWELVSYLFDRLEDTPKYDMKDGTVYGRGQWATSLRWHDGQFYALFSPNDAPYRSYVYTTKDPAKGWTLHSRMNHFHDASLFFDDDGRVYVFSGTGRLTELKPDLTGVKEGGVDMTLNVRDEEENGLLEGSRVIKKDGKYYLLMISWPNGGRRRQLCYRADRITGPYEKKVILCDNFAGFPYVGQGTIVDDAKGNWYGWIFQDRGAIGRVPTLSPCRWIDGWPVLGDENGKGGVFNLVTKRGDLRGVNSKLSWTQVETGSAITWKYPSCILRGDNSVAEFYSVAVTNNYQEADTGTKMIHLGKNTKSTIISKGISAGHSQNSYRGLVRVSPNADNARNYSSCDSLLLGSDCGAHTFPYMDIHNDSAIVEHEATTSKISEDQLFYCNQRGIPTEQAVGLIVNGYAKDVLNKLPMEFAVEAQKLLSVSLEGTVG